MLDRLIDFCVHNRVMVLLATVVVIALGGYAARHITVDAIPDLSDVQVVIRTEYPGQSPRVIEDQVTYPLTTAMLAVPEAEIVRGQSMPGSSFVFIIFEDGTDLYWARSRVLEQLSTVANQLPDGVRPQLGPDATGVGWVYQYVLTTGAFCPQHPDGVWHDAADDQWYAARDDAPPEARDRLQRHRIFPDRDTCPLTGQPLRAADVDLAELRSLQDWFLRFELTAVAGVSEVAPVGGFVKQYQVTVDPVRLQAYDVALADVRRAIEQSNTEVGGRLIERSETEYMVRGRGYLGTLDPEQRKAIASAANGGEALALERARTEQVLADLRRVVLRADADGTPITLADVADVRTGPEIRRGVAEWNGEGEVVAGTVVMRTGENAQRTIDRVRDRLAELESGLPPGVAVRAAYDRSDLIGRAVGTLRHTLIEEMLIVTLVIVLFLLHARSALVAAFVLPTGVLAALGLMYLIGINANIMSLGGIAISIGVMVDSAIVMVENAHKHLERRKQQRADDPDTNADPDDARHTPLPLPEQVRAVAAAAREVGPTLFFSLLIVTVSFLPIFVLGEQAGRMFKPLAFTKTFAIAAAALLAVTIIPVLMVYFVRERILPAAWSRPWQWAATTALIALPTIALMLAPMPTLGDHRTALTVGWIILSALILIPQGIISEDRNPLSRALHWLYQGPFVFVMQFRLATLLLAAALIAATWYPLSRLGNEFMPPLEEGDLLYMPTTDPGISITKARELLQQTDKLIMQFPEVKSAFGKIGRADTATDPAPISMIETTITLHRDRDNWRQVPVQRFYDDWPDWAADPLRAIWPDSRPITSDELIHGYEVMDTDGEPIDVPGMDDVLQLPGVTNSWTMPIRTRLDMLATGIRTPVGIKVLGPDLNTLGDLAGQISEALRTDPLTAGDTTSAYADRTVGGYYLDITPDRDRIAREGLSMGQVQAVIASAMGGKNLTHTVEGRQRYPVNLRYPADLRDDPEDIRQILVDTPQGRQIPLGQLAEVAIRRGPPMIKSENARPAAIINVDIADVDVGGYVADAKQVVERHVDLPPGYSIVWSGQYEYMQAARQRLMIAVPLAALAILVLLYLATRSPLRVLIVLLAVPFSLVGAIWLTWLLGYNISLAVWVGIIALAGLDAETGLVMLLYLDNSYERARKAGRLHDAAGIWWAVHEGAVQRIRPKTMTVVTTFSALLPLLFADGAGADTMRRLAAPMIGGLVTSFAGELLFYPVIFSAVRTFQHRTGWSDTAVTAFILLTAGLGLLALLAYNHRHRHAPFPAKPDLHPQG